MVNEICENVFKIYFLAIHINIYLYIYISVTNITFSISKSEIFYLSENITLPFFVATITFIIYQQRNMKEKALEIHLE